MAGPPVPPLRSHQPCRCRRFGAVCPGGDPSPVVGRSSYPPAWAAIGTLSVEAGSRRTTELEWLALAPGDDVPALARRIGVEDALETRHDVGDIDDRETHVEQRLFGSLDD